MYAPNSHLNCRLLVKVFIQNHGNSLFPRTKYMQDESSQSSNYYSLLAFLIHFCQSQLQKPQLTELWKGWSAELQVSLFPLISWATPEMHREGVWKSAVCCHSPSSQLCITGSYS